MTRGGELMFSCTNGLLAFDPAAVREDLPSPRWCSRTFSWTTSPSGSAGAHRFSQAIDQTVPSRSPIPTG